MENFEARIKEEGFVISQYQKKRVTPTIARFKGNVRGARGYRGVYSIKQLLGVAAFVAYYDATSPQRFVRYLEQLFEMKHPDGDQNARKAFTKLLHDNGLHWRRCCQVNQQIKKLQEKGYFDNI